MLEYILFLIVIQLALVSTTLFIGVCMAFYSIFMSPPPSSTATMPFLIPLSDDLVGKKMPTQPDTGKVSGGYGAYV